MLINLKAMKSSNINTILANIVIAFMLATSLSSCGDDFLDIVPEDRIDKTTFYSTEQELVNAVNGIYAKQRVLYENTTTFFMQESRSDNAALNQQDQPERVASDVFQEFTSNQEMLRTWSLMYDVINHANAVIANDKEVSGDPGLIERLVAEAKFLRAFTYFQIVTSWGPVPLRLEPSTNFDDIIVPTSPASDIYNRIVSDLTESMAVLPDEYDGSSANEVGRATKFSALTLLGKVELQRGNNTAAETALRQVIGEYSLLPNFEDIHAAGNNNTVESIYEVSFDPSGNTGYFVPVALIPVDEALRLGIAAGGNSAQILQIFPTQSLMDAFEPGDLRAGETFSIAVADNDPYFSKYMDISASAQGHDINIVALRYADVLLMLAEAIGEGNEAYELINQVRRRGFGFDPNTPEPSVDINAATPGTFVDKLLHERRVEFAMEHHRWNDLKRLRSPQEIVDLMKAQLLEQEGNNYAITTDDLLFPIPLLEVQIAEGAVTQNPGY